MGRINVTSPIFAEPQGSNNHTVVKLICAFALNLRVCAQGSNKHKVVNLICVCARTTLGVHPCGRGNSAISDA